MTPDREQTRRDAEWIDPHDWLYREVINNRQVVSCRRCGKWDSYRLTGYKPQPPRSECRQSRRERDQRRIEGVARTQPDPPSRAV